MVRAQINHMCLFIVIIIFRFLKTSYLSRVGDEWRREQKTKTNNAANRKLYDQYQWSLKSIESDNRIRNTVRYGTVQCNGNMYMIIIYVNFSRRKDRERCAYCDIMMILLILKVDQPKQHINIVSLEVKRISFTSIHVVGVRSPMNRHVLCTVIIAGNVEVLCLNFWSP